MPETKKIKRLTVDLPVELHARLKIGCINRQTTMNELIRSLIEQEFPGGKKRAASRK